jgi:membrane associated rhomboid family serine protease
MHGSSPQTRTLAWWQRKSFITTFVGAFLLPLGIGLFLGRYGGFLFLFWVLVLALIPVVFVTKIVFEWIVQERGFILNLARHLVPLPPGMIYGTDIKAHRLPAATLSLIGVNALLFFAVPESVIGEYVFFPAEDPRMDEIVVSFFSSAFLHADIYHLFGNMVFLWVFGSALESRVGSDTFLGLYMACIVLSHSLMVLLLALDSGGSWEAMQSFHSLGASGAIAGVMGLFVIRCYFAKVKMAFPIFFIPNISLSLRLQAVLLIGLFFAKDVSGTVNQFRTDIMINYWAHFGGYIGGLAAGYRLGLHRPAAEEALASRAASSARNENKRKEAADLHQDMLERNPHDKRALQYFFERYRPISEEKAAYYFSRLVGAWTDEDFLQAASLVSQYFPRYLNALSQDVLYQLGLHFREMNDLDKAAWCFRIASKRPGARQAESQYQYGLILIAYKRFEAARKELRDVAEAYPEAALGNKARSRLKELAEI